MTDNSTPASLIAGDRWSFSRPDIFADFPAPAFSLTYAFQPIAGGVPVTVQATVAGTEFVVELASATTATWVPGAYRWTAFVTDQAGERTTVDSGSLTVCPDPATSQADLRSHARRMLDAINAVIEGRVTRDVESYSIEGRAITKIPVEQLERLRVRYANQVAREDNPRAGFIQQRRIST